MSILVEACVFRAFAVARDLRACTPAEFGLSLFSDCHLALGPFSRALKRMMTTPACHLGRQDAHAPGECIHPARSYSRVLNDLPQNQCIRAKGPLRMFQHHIMQPRATFLSLCLASLTSTLAVPTVISDQSGLSYVGLRNATSGQDYFLGIPFAKPPVGPLRFKPPIPWSPINITAVNATLNGYSCNQAVPGFVTNSESEDCLTLNICE